jgi:hypothetical protein
LALLGCNRDLPEANEKSESRSQVGVIDDGNRFEARFCAISNDHGALLEHARPCQESLHNVGEWVHKGAALPVSTLDDFSSVRLVIVAGIFGECVAKYALPFQDAAAHLKAVHGIAAMEWIPVSGRSSSKANATAIARWLAEHPTAPGQKLILLGYSKGATDLIEAAVRHEAAIPAGSAIVSVAGAVMGTPVADDGEAIFNALSRLPLPNCPRGDGGGAESLTTEARRASPASRGLPARFRYFSVPAFARSSGVSRALLPSHKALQRRGGRNDGQVLARDAIIPAGRQLGFANADHWAVALPLRQAMPWAESLLDRNDYPRTVLLEAVIASVLAELTAESPPPAQVGVRASGARPVR